jgi:predicted metal-dependent enzyme (double-stranded beta helix superfamily)
MRGLFAAGAHAWSGERRLTSRIGAYTRTCAYRDATFEVLLLNWAAGSASAIHDHGDQHCWMLVLEGGLEVEDYARLDDATVPGYARIEATGLRSLGPGEMDLRSGRFDLHRVVANGRSSAVSLHVYARPLTQFLVYDERAARCESRYCTYDAVLAMDAAWR